MGADTLVAPRRPGGLLTVLRAEAVRTARRWTTYALRAGYVASLAAVIGAVWWIEVQDGSLGSTGLGGVLFGVYRDVVLVLAVVLAPLLVALGGVEDRADGSLELLALSGIRSGWVLIGKVLARLLGLMVVVAGGVPLLGLAVSLGGVAPAEVVNATANALAIMLTLGALTALLATGSRRVVAPVLLSLSWGWLCFFAIPSLAANSIGQASLGPGWTDAGLVGRWIQKLLMDGAVLLPFEPLPLSPVGAMSSPHALGLLPVVVCIAVLGVVASSSGAVFREERSRGSWLRTGSVALLGIGGIACWNTALRIGSSALLAAGVWLGAVCIILFLTAAVVWAGLRVLGDGEPGRERPPRRVVGNPVAWREIWSRAHAGRRPWWWWLVSSWGVVLLLGWWAAPGNPLRVDRIEPSLALLVVGVLVTGLVATTAITQEVANGTLPLLVGTTLSARRIVSGKVLGVAAYGLPVLVAGAAIRGLGFVPWIFGFWAVTTLVCLAGAVVIRPVRLAWLANFALLAAYLLTVPLLELVPGGSAVRRMVAPPVVAEVVVDPLSLALATAAVHVLAVALFAVTVFAVRRRGTAAA